MRVMSLEDLIGILDPAEDMKKQLRRQVFKRVLDKLVATHADEFNNLLDLAVRRTKEVGRASSESDLLSKMKERLIEEGYPAHRVKDELVLESMREGLKEWEKALDEIAKDVRLTPDKIEAHTKRWNDWIVSKGG